MKRIAIAIGSILLALILVMPVHAQSGVIFDQMTIEIWPEYDRPEVLVIYRITLADNVSLPAQVSLLIPRAAGTPYNIAMQDMDGLLYNLPYTTEVQNEFQKVIFTTPSAGLQIEYYDPGLSKEGEKRQFKYVWTTEYEINNLIISVQQPTNASNMQILPSFGAGELKDNGLVYYNNSIGKVKAATPLAVELSYTKPDDQLTVGLQPVQATPLSANTPGKTTPGNLLPWILGGVGLIMLVGGFSWFWLTKNREAEAGATRRRHRTQPERRVSAVSSDAAVYCHQCGRRAGAGDVFCRTCGTRLRGE